MRAARQRRVWDHDFHDWGRADNRGNEKPQPALGLTGAR